VRIDVLTESRHRIGAHDIIFRIAAGSLRAHAAEPLITRSPTRIAANLHDFSDYLQSRRVREWIGLEDWPVARPDLKIGMIDCGRDAANSHLVPLESAFPGFKYCGKATQITGRLTLM
jgi:hypothetical protein